MPAWLVPAILSGLGTAAGALSNRPKEITQKQLQDLLTTQERGESFETTQYPFLSDIQNYLQDFLFRRYVDQANRDVDLSGYTATGLQNINRGVEAQKQILNNILAARGLSYSPMAASALTGIEAGRVGQGVNFLNQIPLLRRDIGRQNLADVSGFLQSLPIGTRSTGATQGYGGQRTTGTTTGTTIYPGDILGGGIGGGASILSLLYGLGAFGKK